MGKSRINEKQFGGRCPGKKGVKLGGENKKTERIKVRMKTVKRDANIAKI